MRLDLGGPVHCSDAALGELADIVIDPTTRRITHLVVEPHHQHERAQLVPIELAGESDGAAVQLSCTLAECSRLPQVEELAYLRLGEFPVEDPQWDVGTSEMLALPYYEAVVDIPGAPLLDYDGNVTLRYDRVPKGEVEVRRSSEVASSDGHRLGHVEGFVVDDEQHIAHVVLERGHLWGKRDVTIPIGAVDRVETDLVVLALSKDEVAKLDAVPVRRWRDHSG